MRYLMMSKASDTAPDEKLYVEMAKFVEELTAAGALLATGGLERRASASRPPATRSR
ncbi:hypothetical protein ACFQX6_13170 [Streptosporangium lutulentum]